MIFYEIKVVYDRQTGEENPHSAKESYLVEGLNCADVETRLMDEIKPYISGDVEVPSCRKTQLYDIIPQPQGDTWFKGKVDMITIQDDGKETRKKVNILIQSDTIKNALVGLEQHLSTLDHEIVSVSRSNILDVIRATH